MIFNLFLFCIINFCKAQLYVDSSFPESLMNNGSINNPFTHIEIAFDFANMLNLPTNIFLLSNRVDYYINKTIILQNSVNIMFLTNSTYKANFVIQTNGRMQIMGYFFKIVDFLVLNYLIFRFSQF